MKSIVCLLFFVLLSGCSSGRYYKTQEQQDGSSPPISQEEVTRIHDFATACETSKSTVERPDVTTVFVHPGLLLLNLNWDQSLAVDSAKVLIRHGYAKDFLPLRDRDTTKVGERMQQDAGTRFIGLHYSMGGQPQLLANTLASVVEASRNSGKELVYCPVLVDPFDIGQINTELDLDGPHLGQVFIVLSEEFSLLRPDISAIREDILNHPKVHMIYAEDIGEKWGHFSALTSVVSEDGPSRFRDILFLIAETAVDNRSSIEFEGRFALLKMKYALEDARPINRAWLRLARELPCWPDPTRIAAKLPFPLSL